MVVLLGIFEKSLQKKYRKRMDVCVVRICIFYLYNIYIF
jgi:hypothetical protein